MDASTTAPLVAALSDIGLRRKENQDSYGHFRGEGPAAAKGHLVVVADGMGGHQGGGVASRPARGTPPGGVSPPPPGAPPPPPPPPPPPASPSGTGVTPAPTSSATPRSSG